MISRRGAEARCEEAGDDSCAALWRAKLIFINERKDYENHG
jgi:hypothetical protein